MTPKQVGEKKCKHFWSPVNYFVGQTGGVAKDGRLLIYPQDVIRFLDKRGVID